MSYKLKWTLLRATSLKLNLVWIDIKYNIYEWLLDKTLKWRMKHTRYLKLSSMAYHSDRMTWDDVDVSDQWGHWVPLGFTICSKLNWEFDNEINKKIGEPEDPWEEIVKSSCLEHNQEPEKCPINCGWTTYYVKEDYLDSRHYFNIARKHFKRITGDATYEKDIELRLYVQSQKSLDDDTKQYVDWVSKGSPALKVEFTDQAKEDMKRLFGEDEANKLFKDVEERNKDIDKKQEDK